MLQVVLDCDWDRLLTSATFREVNALVVATRQEVVRKKPGAPLHGRVDSFVVETDVLHPTDVSLLWDAIRTALAATVQLARTHELAGWRQHRHWRMKLHRRFQAVRRKQGWTQTALVRPYLQLCKALLARMQASRDVLPATAATAMRMSCTPRVFRSFKTDSQNFAPSRSVNHMPRIGFIRW